MGNEFILGAYWPARVETPESCTKRLLEFASELGECDPLLSAWRDDTLGRKHKDFGKLVDRDSSEEDLLNILNRGRNRRDSDHKVIEDLGYQLVLSNGRRGVERAQLFIRCGMYLGDQVKSGHT